MRRLPLLSILLVAPLLSSGQSRPRVSIGPSVAVRPLVFEPAPEGQPFFTSRAATFRAEISGDGIAVHVPHQKPLRLHFLGTRGTAVLQPLEPTGGTSNYFMGLDMRRRGVPHFRKVVARNVWPDMDIVYYGKPGAIEYDVVAHPGASTRQLRMRWEGPDEPQLTDFHAVG